MHKPSCASTQPQHASQTRVHFLQGAFFAPVFASPSLPRMSWHLSDGCAVPTGAHLTEEASLVKSNRVCPDCNRVHRTAGDYTVSDIGNPGGLLRVLLEQLVDIAEN